MKRKLIWLLLTIISVNWVQAQETTLRFETEVPAQNLLKFNRFLINPTFSTVREDKSYINLYHRNENGEFNNAKDLYFISYSGRMGDRTGFGLSLFQQKYGTFSNFGAMANYGYGVRLAEKSALSFGFNLLYYNSGYDSSEAVPGDLNDPLLAGLDDGSFISFQPGINLAIGDFDFGIYAENLLDYNFKTSESLTNFKEKTYSAHLQYTNRFENASGILEQGRLMALARGRKKGEEDIVLSGSLILDLPKIGWLQGGYDDFYGASAGIGFNVTKRLSLGYTIEKGLNGGRENLGPTHEVSFAYSFEPNLTEDRVMLEQDYQDEVAEAQQEFLNKDTEIAELKKNIQENNEIIAELIFRQDSIEDAREKDLERRFAHLMRFINRDQKQTTTTSASEALAEYNRKDREAALQKNDNTVSPKTDQIVANNEVSGNKPTGINKEAEIVKTDDISTPENDVAVVSDPVNEPQKSAVNTAAVAENNEKDDVVNTEAAVAQIMEDIEKENTSEEQVVQAVAENNVPETVQDRTSVSEPSPEDIKPTEVRPKDQGYAKTKKSYEDAIDREAINNNVKSRRVRNLTGVDGGYYIIANVYKGSYYFNKFMEKLANDGLEPRYFVNPENGMKYVYLKKFDNWQQALASYKSDIDGQYFDDIWIMSVDNGQEDARYASQNKENTDAYISSTNNTNQNKYPASGESNQSEAGDKKEYDPAILQKNVIKKSNRSADPTASVDTMTENQIEQIYGSKTGARRKTAKKGPVVSISNLQEGYYIIANVFAVPSNATRFVKKLKSQGLDADFFINPNNNYRYVYLRKYDSWNNALVSYYSNLDNSYHDDIWIMRVNTNLML